MYVSKKSQVEEENSDIDDESAEQGILTLNRIKSENCIDMLKKTADGTSLAYIRLDCSNK